MKIVIVHYHLRPGGVTSVIRQQVTILAKLLPNAEIVVLVGENDPSFDQLPCTVVIDPNLDYYVPRNANEAADREKALLKKCISQLSSSTTIFHIHNPTLGKNPCLTGAIHLLAHRDVKIISFCHDFSEDRPANQLINEKYATWCSTSVKDFLYPDMDTIHYATINSADLLRLRTREFKKSTTQLIPSPVQKSAATAVNRSDVVIILGLNSSKEWIFYPVRAIERKNIGEFILMALIDGGSREWLLARSPANENEIPLYEKWVSLARDKNIQIHFDVVENIAFSDLMNSADKIVTTSTREGFGMAYLEPWFAGKPVAGREIPMVVDDMRSAGVQLDRLYLQLEIPLNGEWVDFGGLNSDDQLRIVSLCADSEDIRKKIRERGNWWEKVTLPVSYTIIEKNQIVIDREFSGEAFGNRLVQLYTK